MTVLRHIVHLDRLVGRASLGSSTPRWQRTGRPPAGLLVPARIDAPSSPAARHRLHRRPEPLRVRARRLRHKDSLARRRRTQSRSRSSPRLGACRSPVLLPACRPSRTTRDCMTPGPASCEGCGRGEWTSPSGRCGGIREARASGRRQDRRGRGPGGEGHRRAHRSRRRARCRGGQVRRHPPLQPGPGLRGSRARGEDDVAGAAAMAQDRQCLPCRRRHCEPAWGGSDGLALSLAVPFSGLCLLRRR